MNFMIFHLEKIEQYVVPFNGLLRNKTKSKFKQKKTCFKLLPDDPRTDHFFLKRGWFCWSFAGLGSGTPPTPLGGRGWGLIFLWEKGKTSELKLHRKPLFMTIVNQTAKFHIEL